MPKTTINTSPAIHKDPILKWGAAYVAPHIGVTVILVPMNIVVNGIYSEYFGLALTTIATIILASRFIEAFADPLIGYFSDHLRLKTGTRKPIVLAGGILVSVSSYFLYQPPHNVSVGYFACWYFSLSIGMVLFDLPHTAWGGEIAGSSQQKSFIYSLKGISNYTGHFLFFLIPMLPFFANRKITPEVLQFSTFIGAALLLPCIIIAYKLAPDGKPVVSAKVVPAKNEIENKHYWVEFKTVLREIGRNRPFMIFMAAALCMAFAMQMWYSLIFIYISVYLDKGDIFAQVFLLSFVFGILATPLWYRLSICWGRKTVWLLSATLLVFSFLYTGTLNPENTGFKEFLFLKLIQTLGMACTAVVAPSMLSDISDYGTLKSRTERNGLYFAAQGFLGKAQGAFGAALGLAIAGWFGFDAGADSHSEEGILGLTLAIAWIPSLFTLVAMVCIALSPINERRHAIIRRRLEARLKFSRHQTDGG